MVEHRPLRTEETSLLEDFLYLAIHQPEGAEPLPRSIIEVPDLAAYIEGWGRPDDLCFVAVEDAELIGAAWSRVFPDDAPGYGTIAPGVPELSMSVLPEHRGRGIGTELLRRLLHALAERGVAEVSLSVQQSNPAHRLYRRLGFTVLREHEGEWVMRQALQTRTQR